MCTASGVCYACSLVMSVRTDVIKEKKKKTEEHKMKIQVKNQRKLLSAIFFFIILY